MAGPVVGGGNEGERRQRLRLLQSLDPSSEEVVEATGALNRMFRFLRFAPGAGWGGKGMGGALVAAEDLALRNMKSYGVIRSSYKLQRQSKRQNNGKEASSQFLHFLKLLVDIRFYYNIAIEFLKSTSRVVIFMILDLVADLLFCTLYLYELQWNVSFKSEIQGKSPQFLWTPRRLPTFSIGVALTAFNIISRVLKTAFSDNKLKAFFNFSLLIDAITSYPFLIVLSIQDGHQIYIPYFLRSLIIVSRLMRPGLKILSFDAITEKLFLVIATILSIIYTGLCSFQYIEYNFREDGSGADLTLMDCFYFIVVTLSTVGYGDITTKTVPGQFLVIIIILVALSTIPGLIGSLVDAFTVQKSGGGYFARGTSSFVVVVGHFDTVAKIVDVMESFLDQEEGELPLKLVLMARAPASPAIKGLLNQSLYKERVTYLVGQAMDVQDLKRARIQYASATYIIADRSANSPRKEDERNTLRAWAIDEFAPLTPLFVSNLLQESEAYQEQTVTAFVCVEELKQLIIGHTTLFNGSSTFLINLVHKHSPFDSYPEVWQAQYGDGAGNEIYLSQLNAVFAGHRYVDVAWYIFKEFQTILAGIKVFVKEMNAHHHILNPGQAYILQRTDMCIFIAQSPKEIREINSLTFDEFNTSLERDASHSFVFAASSLRRRKAQIDRSVLPANANLFRVINKEGRYKTQPVTLVEAVVKSRANLIGHIVVCTGNYHVFKFVCTLRAAQLTEEDFRPIVFLCVRAPSEEEFHYFSVFPAIYFVVGDPMNKRDLHRAGIEGAHKVIIMNMSSGTADDFADGTSIMLSHLIYAMFPPPQPKKCVIIELSKRAHINFLRPSAKRRTRRSQHRKASAVQGLDYMYAPVFAAGRVVAATMLDCILFGLLSNSSILDIFKLFCGVRISRDVEMDKFLGITPAYLNQIDVPDAFVVSAVDQWKAKFAVTSWR
ncbi:hypothetical protein DFJ73DRAFT_828825 [Zopfochytrium polystomum]|nr:hypothetical protein DFJ73DRAFT_828825 [Zopfochytrium polystomum]